MDNYRGQFNNDGKECIHHWLIDERNSGVCKKCGVSKQFSSSWGNVQKSWYARAGKVPLVVPVTKELTDPVV
jgi:hypothetical protein